jgi:hypothetical protein
MFVPKVVLAIAIVVVAVLALLGRPFAGIALATTVWSTLPAFTWDRPVPRVVAIIGATGLGFLAMALARDFDGGGLARAELGILIAIPEAVILFGSQLMLGSLGLAAALNRRDAARGSVEQAHRAGGAR